jgi:hypothetical protein
LITWTGLSWHMMGSSDGPSVTMKLQVPWMRRTYLTSLANVSFSVMTVRRYNTEAGDRSHAYSNCFIAWSCPKCCLISEHVQTTLPSDLVPPTRTFLKIALRLFIFLCL